MKEGIQTDSFRTELRSSHRAISVFHKLLVKKCIIMMKMRLGTLKMAEDKESGMELI